MRGVAVFGPIEDTDFQRWRYGMSINLDHLGGADHSYPDRVRLQSAATELHQGHDTQYCREQVAVNLLQTKQRQISTSLVQF